VGDWKYKIINGFLCLVVGSTIIVLSSCGGEKPKGGVGKSASSGSFFNRYSYPDYSTPENVVKTNLEAWYRGHRLAVDNKCSGVEYDKKEYEEEVRRPRDPKLASIDSYRIIETRVGFYRGLPDEAARRWVIRAEITSEKYRGNNGLRYFDVKKQGDHYVILQTNAHGFDDEIVFP